MEGYMDIVKGEMNRLRWIWADVAYNEYRGEFRYYFHTEKLKLTCVHIDAREHHNSYFKIIGISEKNAYDRLNSVKYGVKLYLSGGFTFVSGEYWQLPKNRYSCIAAEKIYFISSKIRNFHQDYNDNKKVQIDQKYQERLAWAKEMREFIDFQNDYEVSNAKAVQFAYKSYEPVTSARVVGVSYKFILSDFREDELVDGLIGKELIVAAVPFVNPDDIVLKGIVVEYSASNKYIIIAFQSTIDFGKFPASGYLLQAAFNLSYRIQAKAVNDLVEGRAVNKSLLDIIIDNRYEDIPDFLPKSYPGLNHSQEMAVNLALHTKDFLLVQGPPGTGKTRIIVEMLKEFVAQGKRVLVSSKNHLAVDNVLEKCIKNNISCIRLGQEERVKLDSVKKRLIDRAAVELQRDIINNCDNRQVEILQQTKNQEKLCDILDEQKEHMLYFIELRDKLRILQSKMTRREKLIKVIHFYKYIQLSLFKVMALIRSNQDLVETKRSDLNKFIEDKLCKDKIYVKTKELWDESKQSMVIHKVIIDKALDSIKDYKTFDYEAMSRDDIQKGIAWEKELYQKFKRKSVIIKDWKDSLEQRQQSLYPLLLDSVMVVGATCIGINTSAEFKSTDFDIAIIDEAGQITIFDIIVPMSRAKKVILIGDHMQLPPTCDESLIKEIEEERAAGEDGEGYIYDDASKLLGQSLFETLFYSCPNENKIMLDQQYRMHPIIAEFISNEFYEGKYKSGVSSSARELKLSVFNKPLYFVDTLSCSARRFEQVEIDGDHNVYYNILEADIISNILINLLSDGIKADDIGIITPYKRQKTEIYENIIGTMNARGMDEADIIEVIDKLEIDTVDSFQGRDKNIIIFSFTRSNEEHAIGFLSELRRINVTMTRAKYMLIMVGDSETLTKARNIKSRQFFINLVKYVKNNGVYINWDELASRL